MVAIPDVLTLEYIAERWPRLYHMAEAGTWPSIQQHGLLSTSALLDLFEIAGPERDQIEAERRPESIPIHHPVHGTAWVRDNKPTIESVLQRTLVGMSVPDWYRTLNHRVFFWLTEDRLNRLRAAPPYRDRKHDIIILDTGSLLTSLSEIVELSPINSGATHPAANYSRGIGTFRRISDYQWKERLLLSRREPIVELTVPYSVQDPSSFLVEVQTR